MELTNDNDEVRIDLEDGRQGDDNAKGSPNFSVPLRRHLKSFKNVVDNLTQGITNTNSFTNVQSVYKDTHYVNAPIGSILTEENNSISENRIYSAFFSLEFKGTLEELSQKHTTTISKQALEEHLSSSSPDPYVAWRDWERNSTSEESMYLSNVFPLGLRVRSYNNSLPFSIFIKSDDIKRWNVVLFGNATRGLLRMMPYSTCHTAQTIIDHRRALDSSEYKEYALGCLKRFQSHIVPIASNAQEESFSLWVHSKLAIFIKERYGDILSECNLTHTDFSLEEIEYPTNNGMHSYYTIPLNIMTISLAMYAHYAMYISPLNEEGLSFSIHPTNSNWEDTKSKEPTRSAKTKFEIGIDLELYFSYSPEHLLNK